MSQQILLTLNDTAGNALGQYSINTAGSALHIQAVDGVYYHFTDTATGMANRDVAAVGERRTGHGDTRWCRQRRQSAATG